MCGALALFAATCLPVTAGQADAAELAALTRPTVAGQNLAVSTAVEVQERTRDGYTVISAAQKARPVALSRNYSYTTTSAGAVQWPFPQPVPISSGFGPRSAPCGHCSSFHEGIDFLPGAGVPIRVVADGIVSVVDSGGAWGYHVIVDHMIDGVAVQTLYAHMRAGSIAVAVGQSVKVTDTLGIVGNTGESTGTHLHLEVHINNVPIDPFAWLKKNVR